MSSFSLISCVMGFSIRLLVNSEINQNNNGFILRYSRRRLSCNIVFQLDPLSDLYFFLISDDLFLVTAFSLKRSSTILIKIKTNYKRFYVNPVLKTKQKEIKEVWWYARIKILFFSTYHEIFFVQSLAVFKNFCLLTHINVSWKALA